MRRLLKPGLVAIALVIAGITQAVAGGPIGTLGPLTVTPEEGFPGDPFTVSGQNCPPQLLSAGVGTFAGIQQVFQVTVTMTGPGSTGATYPLGTVEPEQDGTWTLETSVPEEAPPSEEDGDYTINADCTGSFPEGQSSSLKASGLSIFAQGCCGSYDPHPFTVLAEAETGPGVTAPEEEEDPEVEAEAEAADPVEVQPAFTG